MGRPDKSRLRQYLDDVAADLIRETLEQKLYHREDTARELGITRYGLRNWMKRLGITAPRCKERHTTLKHAG